jgi:hypothetical protein
LGKAKPEYPAHHKKAINVLLPFELHRNLRGATFLAMIIIKSKQRSRSVPGPALRPAVTSLSQKTETLATEKEQQQSLISYPTYRCVSID